MRIAIIGGTGFIGRHLVDALAADPSLELAVLSRRATFDGMFPPSVRLIQGDLLDERALDRLLTPESVLINLAWLSDGPLARNLELAERLVGACNRNGVTRLVHLSTAVVAGRAAASLVDESTPARPHSEYERLKLAVEELILAEDAPAQSLVLRPTAVFGPGGQNLLLLANELTRGSRLKNYLKSCLYGRRTLNLVPVATVVSAIRHMVHGLDLPPRAVYQVADDEAPRNTYRDVEDYLQQAFELPGYPIPRITLPEALLRRVLALLDKPNIDPQRRYSSARLEATGWARPVSFDQALTGFANWFRSR